MAHHDQPLVLNNERLDAMINAVCPEYCECFPVRVLNHGSYRQMFYEVDGWFVSDEMFVEGNRIMRYIAPY